MNKAFNKIVQEINDSGREILLLAVTKNVDANTTNEIIKDGARAIGENRVEVFADKEASLLPVEKHFIGRIQSRKIKKIVKLFDVIQSLASIKHLRKINNEAISQDKDIRVLLQFNISGETQKDGFDPRDTAQIILDIKEFTGVRIIGLMGMATDTADTEIIRKQFRLLRRTCDEFSLVYPDMTELSMGMSNDYRIAIEEGASMLRLGSILFDD
ncbi:MAG: YggS family pyridoxal phosphate-dependent enzyme [Patescibacteria group bacterium]|nr:YggS family pyridoxal phosphate-dependent enzyme [Patescibacteria group bacterium]